MKYLEDLNSSQKEAVLHNDGPLIVLAGAGTGKTRVLTTKLSRIIRENFANPYEILTVTFTNKAANEMKNRVESILGDVDRTVSTSDFRETLKTWTQIYIYETDRLAMHLYVPNYRNPEQARYRFNREGAEFIQALPGPADVAVGTRLFLETNHR